MNKGDFQQVALLLSLYYPASITSLRLGLPPLYQPFSLSILNFLSYDAHRAKILWQWIIGFVVMIAIWMLATSLLDPWGIGLVVLASISWGSWERARLRRCIEKPLPWLRNRLTERFPMVPCDVWAIGVTLLSALQMHRRLGSVPLLAD